MDSETYFNFQITLARAAKKAMNDVLKNIEVDESIKGIVNKINLLALGDLGKFKNSIIEISQILNIDTANTTIDQFLEKITNQP